MLDTLRLIVGLLSGPVGLILLIVGGIRYVRRRRRISVPICGLLLFTLFASTLVTRWRTFELWFSSDITNTERMNVLAAKALPTAPPENDDWPQWRGPNRDGIGRAPTMSTDWDKSPPTVAWSVPIGKGYSSMAIVKDRIYTQDFRGGTERVICLNAENGAELWNVGRAADYRGFKLGYANGPRATPTVHDGRVYTLGATGTVLCLDAEKATVLWEHNLRDEFNAPLPSWGFASSPLIEGDLVMVQAGSPNGSVIAYDRITGNKVWAALDDENGYSSPIAATIAGVRQVVAFTGHRMVGLRPTDGQLLWEFHWPTQYNGNIATPIVAGDQVFISSGYNAGCALLELTAAGDGVNSEPLWTRRNKLLRTHHMTCVRQNEFVYGFDDGLGQLKCVNIKGVKDVKGVSGPVESWESRKIEKGCIILAEGHLIILTQSGDLTLVEANPKEFHFKGKVANVLTGRECWALPALANGRIYVRDDEKLVCLK